MDPEKDAETDKVLAPIAGYTLIFAAITVKTATWLIGVLADGTAATNAQTERMLFGIADAMSGPFINVLCIIAVVLGGFIIVSGDEIDQSSTPVEGGSTPYPSKLPMSEVARSAEARLNGLIAHYRSIPQDLVLPEASVEFDRIESSHVPDLQQAHRAARATVPGESGKAESIDVNYAKSADRISDALERLIEGCEVLARERLEVQGRFIEARHPQDIL